jgi:serine/threonine-protein kinase RsbW
MREFHFASFSQFQKLRETIRDYIREISPQNADLLFVALNEAVNNALFHGGKKDLPPNI